MFIFRVFPCVPWAKKFKLETKGQTILSPDTISSSDRRSQEVADCLSPYSPYRYAVEYYGRRTFTR
jgi:hypothetical protein